MQRVTVENIQQCFPELSSTEKKRLVRKSMQETGKTILETSRYWTRPPSECLSDITRVNDSQLEQLLALTENAHKGIIFVVPHLGNWELINHYLGRTYPMTHMYQPVKSKTINEFILACRKNSGTNFVEADSKGIRAQVKELKAGRNIGAMPDQEPDTTTGEFADFFGIAALTGQLIPGICRMGQSITVMASCCRVPEGFEINLTPIQMEGQTLKEIMTIINHQLEIAIRKHPEQYLWSYKRFRTRPPWQEEFYHLKDSFVKQQVEKILIRFYFLVATFLPAKLNLLPGIIWGKLARLFNLNRSKVTKTNLNLCFPEMEENAKKKLRLDSLIELGKTAMENPKIWRASDYQIEDLLGSIEGLDHLPPTKNSAVCSSVSAGTVVLIPPLGNRELVIRYLGLQYRVFEYYHPNGSSALDQSIRRQRYNAGVSLYPHSDKSVVTLADQLEQGSVVMLCPDQQPRLRGGLFIPFFGEPGLTTLALPTMIRKPEVRIVYGIAFRSKSGFNLEFCPVSIENSSSSEEILKCVNSCLEELIRTHPEQYRWSDKRFNIRPKGSPKVYRS